MVGKRDLKGGWKKMTTDFGHKFVDYLGNLETNLVTQNEGSRILKNYGPISHKNPDLDFSQEFQLTSWLVGRAINTGKFKGEELSLWSFVCSSSW
ncbi:hypothetical protein AVEN_69929-1 [Araneus ventricosus]|uniref:Uncharacterized protein n=1 Tax=Araneus ventricosus TaxID=182803 RepID=A0A4Y2VHS5_ARAVE|nr:hypothetical protein AVEN_5883-1 [Araneus ventricosus]GBO23180.1 hypothetical protein AVEN_69929-1 [Araneus ventricosus]